MRGFIVLTCSLLASLFSTAQNFEGGLLWGVTNVIGDVGPTNYIRPSETTYGGLFKWNRSNRHSYRVSLLFPKFSGKDIKSNDPRRIQRGFEFKNNAMELSLGMEFNYFEFDLHKEGRPFTPYIYAGFSLINYNNLVYQGTTIAESRGKSWNYGIPFALGAKKRLNDFFIVSFEIGARFTFFDDLDGSNPTDNNLKRYSFGNINNKDWYMVTGIMLTYTFGEKPCYCF